MSQQINLFNPIFLRQEKHFSALAMVQGLAIISLVLGGLTAYSNYRLSQLRNDAVTMSKQLTNAQAQRQQLVERDKPKEKNKALEEEIRTLENRLDTRRKVLEFVQHGERDFVGQLARVPRLHPLHKRPARPAPATTRAFSWYR